MNLLADFLKGGQQRRSSKTESSSRLPGRHPGGSSAGERPNRWESSAGGQSTGGGIHTGAATQAIRQVKQQMTPKLCTGIETLDFYFYFY
jgi:hypothetical protein